MRPPYFPRDSHHTLTPETQAKTAKEKADSLTPLGSIPPAQANSPIGANCIAATGERCVVRSAIRPRDGLDDSRVWHAWWL